MATKSLKILVQEAQAASKHLSTLWDEQSSTCDRARYTELTRPGGLVWQAEQAKQTARERLQKRVKAMTGLSAYMFKDLI